MTGTFGSWRCWLSDRLDERRELDRLHSSIAALIADEQLQIAAQPLVDLRDGHCLGVEALSRFRPPFGPPDVTFAAAATVGLGLELERLAVQRAWELLPYLRGEQFVTVNLSPTSAVALARRAHAYSDLPLSKVVVEITEHSAIDSYADLRNELKPLRQAGLRVAVDDAGAGYASLRHVVELNPDFIKIDRDLIHGLADDHARRVAVSAFVLLALDLNATVVAEGLERHEDLEALRDLGVDAAQGYLLGKPSINRRHLTTWLRRQDLTTRA
jgi:EAL domain-containing protein (putative c-di-GMP-specific phosphodiesterase class I)